LFFIQNQIIVVILDVNGNLYESIDLFYIVYRSVE